MKKLIAMLVMAGGTAAQAATDIDGVVSDVSGYADAAIVVGITVVLFVIGRRVIKRLI